MSVYLFVCSSVCQRVGCISKTTCPNITKFLHLTPSLGLSLTTLSTSGFAGDGRHIFQIMERKGQNQRRRICFVKFDQWRHRVRSSCLRLHACFRCGYGYSSQTVTHCCLTRPIICPTGASTRISFRHQSTAAHQQQLPAQALNSHVMRDTSYSQHRTEACTSINQSIYQSINIYSSTRNRTHRRVCAKPSG